MILLALLLAQDGLALLKKGHYLEAKAVIERQQDPLALAELRLLERDSEAAEEAAKRAVERAPEDAHAHFVLGRVMGDRAMAASIFSKMSYARRCREEFEKAAELDPNSAEAREALGEYYAQAPSLIGGDMKKARAIAAELVQIDPVRGYLAQAARAEGDPSPYFEKAAAAAKSADDRLSVAYAVLRAKRDASSRFRSAAEAFPADPRPQIGLADALLQAGDADGAIAAARRAVAIDPLVPPGHFFLAEALLKKGDKAAAKAEYEAYLKVAPPKVRRADLSRERLKSIE